MGKAGRKRKPGFREPNGKPQRPSSQQRKEQERARRLGETRFVADQPHRRGKGDDHPWAGSVLGRFCLANKLSPEQHEGGRQFGLIVSRWRSAKGIPVQQNRTPGPTPEPRSDEDERKRVDKLKAAMVACERVLLGQGTEAFIAVRQLTLDENDLTHEQDAHAIMGLSALAHHMGLLGRHPFQGGR